MLPLTSVRGSGMTQGKGFRGLILAGDSAAMSALRSECRSMIRGGGLDASADLDDFLSEAVAAVVGGVDDCHAAALAGYAAVRRDRLGGSFVGFSYLSESATDEDGETRTLGDVLGDRIADRSSVAVNPADLDYDRLARTVGAVRVDRGYAAHGAVMARGAANAVRGALNDADVLRALEAVGGRRYGYAAAMVRWFAAEGIVTTTNAIHQAVFRALRRTEGGHHSSRC